MTRSPFPSRLPALLAVVALMVTAVFGGPIAAGLLGDVVGPTAGDVCCDETRVPDEEGAPNEDDCCPSDCQDCPLFCCSGSLVMNVASLSALTTPLESMDVIPAIRLARRPVDPHGIEHPPRI